MANESVTVTQTLDQVTVVSEGPVGLNAGGTIGGPLTVGVDGTGHDVKFFGDTAGKYMQWDQSADKLFINGELEVNGSATTFNSTVITIDDPIFSLGGQQRTDALDDSKDRGLEFFYHDGAQKTGFMGYDDSADAFTFLTSATNSNEVFSGTAATVQMGHLNFVEGSGGQIQFNGTEKINIGTNNIGLRKPIYGMVSTIDIGLSSNPFRDGHFSGTLNTGAVTASGDVVISASNSRFEVIDTDSSLKTVLAAGDSLGTVGTYTNHPFHIRTNTQSAIVVDTSQRVGIGTAAPAGELEIQGSGDLLYLRETGREATTITGQGNGSGSQMIFKTHSGSALSEAMRILPSGNVGIGVAAPSELLHVSSATSHKPVLLVENTNADSSGAFLRLFKNTASAGVDDNIGAIQFQSNNNQGSGRVFAQIAARIHDPVAATATGELKFNTFVSGTDTTVMTMLDGNVGIGTSSPSTLLECYKSGNETPLIVRSNLTTFTGIGFRESSASGSNMGFVGIKRTDSPSSSDSEIHLRNSKSGTVSTSLMVDTGGNVGIGTSSPSNKLSVNLAANGDTVGFLHGGVRALEFERTSFDDVKISNTRAYTSLLALGTAGGVGINIKGQGSGNGSFVGIGTTAPAALLEVVNTGATSAKNLRVKAVNGQTGNLIEAVDGGNSPIFEVGRGAADGQQGIEISGTLPITGTRVGSSTAGLALDFSNKSIQSYASTALTINSAGNNVILVPNSGKVGIGTSSPSTTLEVAGAKGSAGVITVSDTASVAAGVGGEIDFKGVYQGSSLTVFGSIEAKKTNATAGDYGAGLALSTRVNGGGGLTERLTILEGGNVGIGTAAPSALLDVAGPIFAGTSQRLSLGGHQDTFTGSFSIISQNDHGDFSFASNLRVDSDRNFTTVNNHSTMAGGAMVIAGNGNSFGVNSIYFLSQPSGSTTAGTEVDEAGARMIIKNDGNVGIGTTSPDEKFHVHSSSAAKLKLESSGSSDTQLIFENSNRRWLTYQDSVGKYIIADNTAGKRRIQIPTDGSMSFDTNSATALQISSAGNVGIGTAAPLASFHSTGTASNFAATRGYAVFGDGSGDYGMTIYGSASSNGIINFADGTGSLQQNAGSINYDHANDSLKFATNQVERLRLESGGLVRVFGDLQVDGTTTTVNSTVVTIDDPVLTLGGDTAPSSDDNKDRGIEFRYYDGSAKVGFMGWDDSAGGFTFLKGATNSSEVFSGTAASLATGAISAGGNLTMGGNQITGVSVLGGSGSNLQINASNGEHFLYGAQDGQVVLYHNGVQKFQTASVGILVSGRATLEQSQDDNGLEVKGYDDKSGETLKAYVQSSGNSRLNATRKLSIYSGDSYGGGIGSASNGLDWDSFNQFTFTAESPARIPLSIEGASGQSGDLFNITSNGGSAGDLLTVASDGKFGIGVAAPSTKLHILNGTGNDPHIRLSDPNSTSTNDATGYLEVYHGATTGRAGYFGMITNAEMAMATTTSSGKLSLYTGNGVRALSIDNSQRVGIGTSSPSGKLHVNVPNHNTISLQLGNDQYTGGNPTHDLLMLNTGTLTWYLPDDGSAPADLQFYSRHTGTYPFVLDSENCRVGINTTSPAYKLDVDGDIRIKDPHQLLLGDGLDIKIYHNSTTSNGNIENHTGSLYVTNYADGGDLIFRSDDGSGGVTEYLRLDGSQADGTNLYTRFPDNSRIALGASNDFQLFHNGSNTRLVQNTGELSIEQQANDQIITLQADNGSGGITPYLTINGGREEVVASKPLVQTPGTVDPANNGELAFTVVSNTSIKIKYKGTDGTVRSTTLTLS